ncbi:MAG: glutamate--tRNA ligase family protein [Deltaproteobacteria bacterium]|jgi:glutamyl/glutaminyl-tRNA synthetase
MKLQLRQSENGLTRGRLAPTPSGFLHLGNGVNFVLTWLMVRQAGGTLKLRIDDADSTRTRPEFVDDIFRQLEWLGLDWDGGPQGPDDFRRDHSQLLRVSRYREMLGKLSAHLFTCTCSRKEIATRSADGLYPGTCRNRSDRPQAAHAVRIRVERECTIKIAGERVPLGRTMGDFVLWRKDDLPAYQLASLADDLDDQINLIVRGRDLLESTAAQLFLAERLGGTAFLSARFHHHPLLTCSSGRKLSKSDQALSLAAMRENNATPVTVYREAARLLGLDPAMTCSLADLMAGYQAAA